MNREALIGILQVLIGEWWGEAWVKAWLGERCLHQVTANGLSWDLNVIQKVEEALNMHWDDGDPT